MKIKQSQPCNAVEHTIADDGDGCLCGYFVRAEGFNKKKQRLLDSLWELSEEDFNKEVVADDVRVEIERIL